jgi:putative acetyltransferase
MIRAFQQKDLDAVMEIWLISNFKVHNFIPKKYWENNFDEIEQILPIATSYVWEDDEGKIDGFVVAMEELVVGLFIREDHWREGIGDALLHQVEQDYDKLSLTIYEKNVPAIRFFMEEYFMVESERVDESTGEKEFFLTWERPAS